MNNVFNECKILILYFFLNIAKYIIKTSCHPDFQLPLSGAHICMCADGTKVTEEFFKTLPDNTELVLLSRDQTWSGGGECFAEFKTAKLAFLLTLTK